MRAADGADRVVLRPRVHPLAAAARPRRRLIGPRSLLSACAALLLALALGACGGGSTSTDTSGAPTLTVPGGQNASVAIATTASTSTASSTTGSSTNTSGAAAASAAGSGSGSSGSSGSSGGAGTSSGSGSVGHERQRRLRRRLDQRRRRHGRGERRLRHRVGFRLGFGIELEHRFGRRRARHGVLPAEPRRLLSRRDGDRPGGGRRWPAALAARSTRSPMTHPGARSSCDLIDHSHEIAHRARGGGVVVQSRRSIERGAAGRETAPHTAPARLMARKPVSGT